MIRISLLLLAVLNLSAADASLRGCGVIGNTGEQGAALIRQTTNLGGRGHGNTVGCGLALDRMGTLWTRMDDDFVSRLSLDGRQFGRFAAPPSANGYDTIASLGDRILLLASGELTALAIDAPTGSAFAPLGVKLRALAHTPVKGRLAAITDQGVIVWVGADGRTEEIARVPDAWLIEADGAGALYVGARPDPKIDGTIHKLVAGTEVTTGAWPKPWAVVCPGIAMPPTFLIWSDGVFFSGGSGHLSAWDADLNPSPGTVLGMQGAYVIGVGADWRQELGAARGIVRLRDGRYVVGGAWGQPFFANWPDPTRSMRLTSWLTARPDCPALNLDTDGNVFVDRLVYGWTATPDSFPVALAGADVNCAIVRAGPRLMVRQDRWRHGGGGWALPVYSGTQMQNADWIGPDKFPQPWWDRAGNNPNGTFPAVAWPEGDGLVFMSCADVGGGPSMKLGADGRFRSIGADIVFALAQPGKELTALALRDARSLFAAIDGQVVELTLNATTWKETRRWSSWGTKPEEKLGGRIHLAYDQGRLLVSDGERHRVLCFLAGVGRPTAQFGTTDKAGNDLQSCDRPGLIAICGARAVVHDGGNQRLVKLLVGE